MIRQSVDQRTNPHGHHAVILLWVCSQPDHRYLRIHSLDGLCANVEQVYILVPPVGLLALKVVVWFVTNLDRVDLIGELLCKPSRESSIGGRIVRVSVKVVAIGDAGADLQAVPLRQIDPVLYLRGNLVNALGFLEFVPEDVLPDPAEAALRDQWHDRGWVPILRKVGV